MSTYAPAGEMSDNRSMLVSDKDQDTIGVGGEVPHEIGTLNAYIYFFQLLVPLIYIDFKFTYS